MSEQNFASPGNDATLALEPLPGLMKGLAIAAIVLGILGFGQGALGIVASLSMETVTELALSSLPSSVQDEYQTLMDAQLAYQPLSWVALFLSLIVCAVMIAGGAVALARRNLALLGWGALGAALIDVINILVQILVRVATNAEWEAYNEAVSGMAGGSAGAAGGMVGMVFGLVLLAAFAAFWGFAFIRIREHANG